MKSKVGLRAQKKAVRGKHGTSIRTYWVKTSPKLEARKGNREIPAQHRHTAADLIRKYPLHTLGLSLADGIATGVGASAGGHLGSRRGVPKLGAFAGGFAGLSAFTELSRHTGLIRRSVKPTLGPYKSHGEVTKLRLAQLGSMYVGYKLGRMGTDRIIRGHR